MKKHSAVSVFVLYILGLCVPAALSQASGSVKGVCKDANGQPIVDGIVVFANQDNGQKYTLKTNKKGEYFSLGVAAGNYTVTLYKNADDLKANKETFHFNKFQVAMDENTLDFDMQKEAAKSAQGQGLTPEQLKQRQEQEAKVQKENLTIKALNEKIVAATAAMKATPPDYDTAIADMTEATQTDATRDVLWAILADAYRGSATKQTDPAERTKRLQEAVTDYGKAIDIKQKAIDADTKKNPDDAKKLAGYYNNMADAAAKSGKIDDAMKAYNQAAQLDPPDAAGYYFNEGAVLTNAGKVDDANTAFDKCIAADPNRAEAYYQKGVNLMGKATLQGDKTIPAPGTVEAFQKYLEIAPTGPNAQNAKDLLASLGATVETSYGKKKGSTKKQ
jgi:tetratricopeptide (TPR) repeat protein